MKKHKYWAPKFLLLLILIASVGFIFWLGSFELFPEEPTLIEKFSDSRGNIFAIYHFPGNATVQENIQLRKLDNGSYETIKIFEGYGQFKKVTLTENNLVQIQAGIKGRDKIDTLLIRLE